METLVLSTDWLAWVKRWASVEYQERRRSYGKEEGSRGNSWRQAGWELWIPRQELLASRAGTGWSSFILLVTYRASLV